MLTAPPPFGPVFSGSASLAAGQTQPFLATVTGTENTAVTWSIEEGAAGGTITPTGLYTAPQTSGTYHVVATSVADPTKSATATVSVVPATFTVSGTVNYAGSKTGRVYVVIEGFNTVGTSLPAPGAFSVRGVQGSGPVTVWAYMDTLGLGRWNNAASPVGGVQVTLGTSDVTGVTIQLVDPPVATPPAPVSAPTVIAGDGAAFVYFDLVGNSQGFEAATHYRVYYSTTPNPGPTNNLGSVLVRPGRYAVIAGLTNGQTWYFSYTALQDTLEGPPSPAASALVSAPASGGLSISGTVTFPGVTSSGPLYLLAFSSNDARLIRIPNPVSPQAYTLAGLTSDVWAVLPFIDQNDDGEIGPTEPQDPTGVEVQLTTSQTDVHVPIDTSNGFAWVATSNVVWSGGQEYSLEFHVLANTKMPVNVTVNGAKLAGPVDLAQSFSYVGYQRGAYILEHVTPVVGDAYALDVTWSDGTSSTLTASVNAVYTQVPAALTPADGATASTLPTFAWAAPAGAPQSYAWDLLLYDSTQLVWAPQRFPQTTTSTVYNSDGSAVQPSLTSGAQYGWYIRMIDDSGNSAWRWSTFQAQ